MPLPIKHATYETPQSLLILEDKQRYIPHDLLFKELIQNFFEQFIEVFFPQFHSDIDFSTVKFLSEEMIADSFAAEKRILDIVIEVKWKETDTFIIVHVEPQSYQQTDFSQRMFRYYSLLFGKYNKPILPIAVFTFKEQPKCEQYSITFKDTTVLTFEYLSLHLSSLNWRKFIRNPNPVSAALMSKMGYNNDEKVQVKIEFIRIMSDLKIDPKKTEFLLRFFEVYLPLTDEEEGIVMTEIRKDPETFDITSLPISYIERGKKIGREEGRKEIKEQVALKLLEENLPVDLIMRTTSLSEKRILELKSTL